MMPWLFLIFISVPILELWLLIWIGRAIHAGPTIALVILTGIIGAALARREGMRTMMKIQERVSAGAIPTDDMIEGMMIFVAAIMLVTPGVITDALGFGLLIGPVRRAIRRRLQIQFNRRVVTQSGRTTAVHFGIDGAFNTHGANAPSDVPSESEQFIDVPFRDVTSESTARKDGGDVGQ